MKKGSVVSFWELRLKKAETKKKRALRGIEWVTLMFPDVNMLVHANVNVPEKVWSHALEAKFRGSSWDRVGAK